MHWVFLHLLIVLLCYFDVVACVLYLVFYSFLFVPRVWRWKKKMVRSYYVWLSKGIIWWMNAKDCSLVWLYAAYIVNYLKTSFGIIFNQWVRMAKSAYQRNAAILGSKSICCRLCHRRREQSSLIKGWWHWRPLHFNMKMQFGKLFVTPWQCEGWATAFDNKVSISVGLICQRMSRHTLCINWLSYFFQLI